MPCAGAFPFHTAASLRVFDGPNAAADGGGELAAGWAREAVLGRASWLTGRGHGRRIQVIHGQSGDEGRFIAIARRVDLVSYLSRIRVAVGLNPRMLSVPGSQSIRTHLH